MNRETARLARFPLLTETPDGRLAEGLCQTIALQKVDRHPTHSTGSTLRGDCERGTLERMGALGTLIA